MSFDTSSKQHTAEKAVACSQSLRFSRFMGKNANNTKAISGRVSCSVQRNIVFAGHPYFGYRLNFVARIASQRRASVKHRNDVGTLAVNAQRSIFLLRLKQSPTQAAEAVAAKSECTLGGCSFS